MVQNADLLQWASAAAFAAVAVLGLRDWRLRPSRDRALLAAALGCLAIVAVAVQAQAWGGYRWRPVAWLSASAFAGSGLAILEYRHSVVPLRRWVRGAAWIGTAGGVAALVAAHLPLAPGAPLTPVQGTIVDAFIGLWALCAGEPVLRFWTHSRTPPPMERARLRLMAGGILGLIVVVVWTLAIGPGLSRGPRLIATSQALMLPILPLLYLAVAPPRRLRHRWLRRAAEQTTRDLLGLGTWYWDPDSDQVICSSELARLYGHRPFGELSLEAALSYVHADDRARTAAAFREAVEQAGRYDLEHRVVAGDGTVRWMRAVGQAVTDPASGRVSGVFGTAQDVTGRRLAEDALVSALRREREAAERMRAIDQMKDSMLAAVSHELRTPLTVVIGLASTLRHPQLQRDPDRMSEIGQRLEKNAYRLEELLTDLLDLDRLGRGIIEPRRRATDIEALVLRVLETLNTGGRPVVVDAPCTADVDPARAERIIENLVANAVKHTPPGTEIRISSRLVEGGVLISVDDDGPGVRPELRERIFEPFVQIGGPSHAPGTGIGLALVARFAEMHGGRAWVEDLPGGGSSFRVLLATADPPPGLEIGPERDDATPARRPREDSAARSSKPSLS
ncbi:MAG TPA: HAMP domain-containing sensor histidine kinase [Actinomycetota bacterium]|nr:HAMP domain-containing sensor histidine kinase [Actinomycetota bacterium]